MIPEARNVLTDTGLWIAFHDASDEHHDAAKQTLELISRFRLLMPWPIYYEVLRTRFVRRRDWMSSLDRLEKKLNIFRVDDSPYRERALGVALSEGVIGKRSLSLVDVVIRLIMEDSKYRVHDLITFNVKDFVDVCRKQRIEIFAPAVR